MALYHKYLVCYDIENNKIRKKFFDSLKDLGLKPLQKSVFYGEMNTAEYKGLQRLAHSLLNADTDKVFWLPVALSPEMLKSGVGYDSFFMVSADGSTTV